MRQKAEDRAPKATGPVTKSVWKTTAQHHAEEAARLEQRAAEFEHRAADESAEAAQERAKAAALPQPPAIATGGGTTGGSSPPVPPLTGNQPHTGEPPLPTGSNPTPPAMAACWGNCDSAERESLPADKILGVWTSEIDGSSIEITSKSPDDLSNLVLASKHRWEGTKLGRQA